MSSRSDAAVFVDYENLFSHLKSRLPASEDPAAHIIDLLEGVKSRLGEESDIRCILGAAYADFSGLSENAYYIQRDLSLNGFEARFVPVNLHDSAFEMKLCVEVLDALHHRSELGTFVIVTGDRELVPLLQAIHGHGHQIILVAFRSPIAAEYLDTSGAGRYYDARRLLSRGDGGPDLGAAGDLVASSFKPAQDLPYGSDRDALDIIDRFFGQYEEIYLTPLLRKLSEELGEIEGHEPKSLIGDLEEAGAARLEKRRGVRYDYTVLILNPDHHEVVSLRESHHEPPPEHDSAYDYPEDDQGFEPEEDDWPDELSE